MTAAIDNWQDRIMEENQDYELIPVEKDNWHVRFITGPFPETIIQYHRVRFDGKQEPPVMQFEYELISSPWTDLDQDDEDLQEMAALVLSSIITKAIEGNYLVTRDIDSLDYDKANDDMK